VPLDCVPNHVAQDTRRQRIKFDAITPEPVSMPISLSLGRARWQIEFCDVAFGEGDPFDNRRRAIELLAYAPLFCHRFSDQNELASVGTLLLNAVMVIRGCLPSRRPRAVRQSAAISKRDPRTQARF
jgi:hypothetical protein